LLFDRVVLNYPALDQQDALPKTPPLISEELQQTGECTWALS
jgi:hypothetical protein